MAGTAAGADQPLPADRILQLTAHFIGEIVNPLLSLLQPGLRLRGALSGPPFRLGWLPSGACVPRRAAEKPHGLSFQAAIR
jgi:hypothetical protein